MDKASSTSAPADQLVTWMACLADETRLRLLRLLERNELAVAELCEVVQLPQSTLSRHLKVLADQGWVRHRRQGTNNLYRTVLDELEPAARKLWLVAREQTAAWATAAQDELRLRQLLADKQTASQAFFAGTAAHWDKLRDELYGRHFTASAIFALLPANWVVADLACGTGRAAADLAPAVKQVIAVDNSAAMLKAARRRTANFSNVDLRRGDLESLPIDDSTCDAALLLLALSYVPEPAVALNEIRRILSPGGAAVIVDLLPHDREDFRVQMGQVRRGMQPDALRAMVGDAKMGVRTFVSLPPEATASGPLLFLAVIER